MAVSESSYAVGNRVYRGGSSAPTRGTVDPSGYVERSMNQNRSGLASAAMRRLQGGQPQGQLMGGPAPAAQPSMAPVAAPQIQSNAFGKLQLAAMTDVTPFQGAKEYAMDYDPQGSQDLLEAKRQRDLIMNQLVEQHQNANREYNIQTRDLETAQPTAFRNLLNRFAGRGLAFSSGYGDQVGETNNQFQNMAADISGKYTAGVNSINSARNAAEEGYSTQAAAIQQAIARRLADQAAESAAYEAQLAAASGGFAAVDAFGGAGGDMFATYAAPTASRSSGSNLGKQSPRAADGLAKSKANSKNPVGIAAAERLNSQKRKKGKSNYGNSTKYVSSAATGPISGAAGARIYGGMLR